MGRQLEGLSQVDERHRWNCQAIRINEEAIEDKPLCGNRMEAKNFSSCALALSLSQTLSLSLSRSLFAGAHLNRTPAHTPIYTPQFPSTAGHDDTPRNWHTRPQMQRRRSHGLGFNDDPSKTHQPSRKKTTKTEDTHRNQAFRYRQADRRLVQASWSHTPTTK